MIVYCTIYFILLACSLYEVVKRKKQWALYMMSIILLLFLIGFRKCGPDYEAYLNYFPALHYDKWTNIFLASVSFEPIFVLLYKISPSFDFLIIIVAILSLIMFSVVLYKLSPYPILSLLISLSCITLMFMGQIRQGLALSLVLSGFVISKKNKILSCILFTMAVFAHYSAFTAFLFWLVPSKGFHLKQYSFIFFLSIVFSFLSGYIIEILIVHLPSFAGSKLSLYVYVEKNMKGYSIILTIYRLIVFTFVYQVLELKKKRFRRITGQKIMKNLDYKLMNLYFVSICIPFFFYMVPQISGRGFLYFSCLDILLIPIAISKLKRGTNRLITSFAVTVLSAVFYIKLLLEFKDFYIPYKNIIF